MMKGSRYAWILVALCLRASAAWASPPTPEALACVSASTDGQVMRDHGQLLAARAQFRACAQPSCPSVVTKSCTEWLIELDRRIPSIVLRVRGQDAQDITHASVLVDNAFVVLDGRPLELDPGAHDVAASAPGWLASEQKVLLGEGEQRRLVLLELHSASARTSSEPTPAHAAASLSSTPAAPPGESLRSASAASRKSEPAPDFHVPVASWILGGVGVVGVASFIVLRTQAASELSHLRETCSPDCEPSLTEPGRHYATAADVSLAVGAVALAGAGTWALVHWLGRESNAPSVAFVPSRSGIRASVWLRF